ncbi:uncharacterized protein LOC144302296 [Canis aureus]
MAPRLRGLRGRAARRAPGLPAEQGRSSAAAAPPGLGRRPRARRRRAPLGAPRPAPRRPRAPTSAPRAQLVRGARRRGPRPLGLRRLRAPAAARSALQLRSAGEECRIGVVERAEEKSMRGVVRIKVCQMERSSTTPPTDKRTTWSNSPSTSAALVGASGTMNLAAYAAVGTCFKGRRCSDGEAQQSQYSEGFQGPHCQYELHEEVLG